MSDGIIISIISLIGTLVGSYTAIRYSHKLLEYRMGKLEEKVDACSALIERVTAVEVRLNGHLA